MKNTNWIPEQGELIEVKFLNSEDWREREFIAMTEFDSFLCWTKNKDRGRVFDSARKIQDEPTCYYKWKKQMNNEIAVSAGYFSEFGAKTLIEIGWERIESTRTTYEELV